MDYLVSELLTLFAQLVGVSTVNSEILQLFGHIMKTSLFKYTEHFNTKMKNFRIKNSDIVHISAQNMDYVYSLEPPRRVLTSTHNLCF